MMSPNLQLPRTTTRSPWFEMIWAQKPLYRSNLCTGKPAASTDLLCGVVKSHTVLSNDGLQFRHARDSAQRCNLRMTIHARTYSHLAFFKGTEKKCQVTLLSAWKTRKIIIYSYLLLKNQRLSVRLFPDLLLSMLRSLFRWDTWSL